MRRILLLASLSGIGPAIRAQAPPDMAALLGSIARQVARLGAAHGPSIWPGFRPDTIPILFVLPERGSLLVHWSGPLPAGYRAREGTPAAAWKDARALGAASTAGELGTRSVAQVVVGGAEPAQLVGVVFHEAFHVFERAAIKPEHRFGRGENAFYVSSYPIFDERNETLWIMEGRALAGALAATRPARRRELARQFVTLRRTRHAGLDPSFAEFDRASELNEGLAEYALFKALEIEAADSRLPRNWRATARRELESRRDRLAEMTNNVSQSFRLRYYATGPAQARLLDAMAGTAWKSRMLAENQYLDEALAQAAGPGTIGAMVVDTVVARGEAKAAIARLQALRRTQVDSLLAQPGVLLELSAAALPAKDFGLCGFDPQNHLQVSATLQIQSRWWKPCAGKSLTSEFNVASVHDSERGTVRAIIGPEGEVTLTAGGKPVGLAEGQTIAEALDVRLTAPKASVQAARARLTRDGRILRITPLP